MDMRTDARPIQVAVTIGGEASEFWRVGYRGVTKIEVYEENGQMAKVSWLAVYEGDVITARVNCAALEYVSY